MSIRSKILSTIDQVAHQQNKTLAIVSDDLLLLDSGLDSLCLAIIVARLEDLLTVDPFSGDEEVVFPATIGDLIRLYEHAAK